MRKNPEDVQNDIGIAAPERNFYPPRLWATQVSIRHTCLIPAIGEVVPHESSVSPNHGGLLRNFLLCIPNITLFFKRFRIICIPFRMAFNHCTLGTAVSKHTLEVCNLVSEGAESLEEEGVRMDDPG